MAHGGLGGQGGIGPAELPLLLYGGRRRQSLLRSEPMVMLQLIVQADSASETVEELGELGTVMFCDLNEGATAFQRNFVAQMRDCDEVERCLAYIEKEVAAAGLKETPLAKRNPAAANFDFESPPPVERLSSSFDDSRRLMVETVKDLKQLQVSESQLSTNYNHLVELSHVLQKCDDIFSEARSSTSTVVPRTLSSADLAQGSDSGGSASGSLRGGNANAARRQQGCF